MTKSFDEVLQSNRAPDSEWEVIIDGNNFSDKLELLEFEHKINNSMKFTIRLSGIDKSVTIPVDSEVLIKYNDGLILRGVLREFNPTSFNQYEFEGSGYAAELEADSETVFENEGVNNPIKDTDVETVVNTLVNNSTVPNNRTFSTEFEGGVASREVDDFRAKERQMSDINKLLGAYDAEWYVTTQQTVDPVLQITDQIFFTEAADDSPGNPKDVFKTFGKDQNVDKIDQNVNRNLGDFDSVIVRGFGDGDDQIQAKSGNSEFGKGERTLVYTDKSIISEEQAQKKADKLKETQSVDWREIEVELSNPNQIFGIGDEIKVDSPKAKVSGNFRIVEVFYKIRPEFNVFEARINLSNKPQTFTDDFLRLDEQTTGQTDFGQGNRNTLNESNQDLAGSNSQGDQEVTVDFNIPPELTLGIAGKDNTKQVLLDFVVKNFKKTFEAGSSNVSDDGTIEGVQTVDDFGDVEESETKAFPRDNDNNPETNADIIKTPTTKDGGSAPASFQADDSFADNEQVTAPKGSFVQLGEYIIGEDFAGAAGADVYFSMGIQPQNVNDIVDLGTTSTQAGIAEFDVVVRNTEVPEDIPNDFHTMTGEFFFVDQNGDGIADVVGQATLNGVIHLPGRQGFQYEDGVTFELNFRSKDIDVDVDEFNFNVITYDFHNHQIEPSNNVENIQAFTLKEDSDGNEKKLTADKNSETTRKKFSDDGDLTVNDLSEDAIILKTQQTQAQQLTVEVNGTEITQSPFDLSDISSGPPYKKSGIPLPLDQLKTPGDNRVTLATDDTALVKGNVIVDHKVGPDRE